MYYCSGTGMETVAILWSTDSLSRSTASSLIQYQQEEHPVIASACWKETKEWVQQPTAFGCKGTHTAPVHVRPLDLVRVSHGMWYSMEWNCETMDSMAWKSCQTLHRVINSVRHVAIFPEKNESYFLYRN